MGFHSTERKITDAYAFDFLRYENHVCITKISFNLEIGYNVSEYFSFSILHPITSSVTYRKLPEGHLRKTEEEET